MCKTFIQNNLHSDVFLNMISTNLGHLSWKKVILCKNVMYLIFKIKRIHVIKINILIFFDLVIQAICAKSIFAR